MADAKTTALTAATSWASGDLLYMVSDPAGTPASRKITLDNIFAKVPIALPFGYADAPITRSAANRIIIGTAGPVIGTGGLLLQTADTLGWSDVAAIRENAGTLALRDAATPRDHGIRLYNDNGTWDATTNYERGGMLWSGAAFQVGTFNAGTGTARQFELVTGTGQTIYFRYGASARLQVTTNEIRGQNAADFNLGAAGQPFRDLFLRPSASLTPNANGDVTIEFTNNTTITLKGKGSDGTVRSVALTLA